LSFYEIESKDVALVIGKTRKKSLAKRNGKKWSGVECIFEIHKEKTIKILFREMLTSNTKGAKLTKLQRLLEISEIMTTLTRVKRNTTYYT